MCRGDGRVVRFGWMGVDLFFVLSGFLIAGQLLRPWARGQAPSYSRFMTRRLLRTLPAYLVVVAVYFLIPSLRDGTQLQPLWRFLSLTQNIGLDHTPSNVFSPAWSLCVEAQFYLLFPLMVACLAVRPSAAKVTATVLAVLLFAIAIRGYLWIHEVALSPPGERDGVRFMTLIYYPTWSRLDGLLAGVVAALVQTLHPGWWRILAARPNLLLICGVVGIAATAVSAAVRPWNICRLCSAILYWPPVRR